MLCVIGDRGVFNVLLNGYFIEEDYCKDFDNFW